MKNNKNSALSCISYKGSVITTLMVDNKPVDIHIGHNNGCPSLFRFLCSCLAGDYNDADGYRPLKLQLCKNDNASSTLDEALDSTAISNLLTISEPPKVNHFLEGKNEKYTVTFHFVIPFSVLTLVSQAETIQINQLLLFTAFTQYGIEASKEAAKQGIIAYHKLTNPIEIGTRADNVNLLIDWTMEFTNSI